MSLLIFGGTTEAREILEHGIPALCCVATEYGARLVKNLTGVKTIVGRLDETGMAALINSRKIKCVIDATHPYAVEATRNIKAACESTHTPLLRVNRLVTSVPDGCEVTRVRSCDEAAKVLNARPENEKIFLTVGSKELKEFRIIKNFFERVYVRVLPVPEVLRACEDLGFNPSNIMAMQGPFSYELNYAMFRSSGASVIVTKDSGNYGGVNAKLRAARDAGLEIILIERPNDGFEHNSATVQGAVLWARQMLGLSRPPFFPLMIDLENRDVLIVGGGKIAARRAATFLKCGANVRAVSLEFIPGFPDNAKKFLREFMSDDLNNVVLAVAASDNRRLNYLVGLEAKKRKIPVSVADSSGECDFFFPSLINSINSEYAAASVCSAGMSSVLTRKLSDRLREIWPSWVEEEVKKYYEKWNYAGPA